MYGNYFVKGTDIIAYAFDAEILCVDCTHAHAYDWYHQLTGNYPNGAPSTEDLLNDIARVKDINRHDVGTDVMPVPCFGTDTDTLNDSCGSCHNRIADTL